MKNLKRFEELNEGIREGDEIGNNKNVTSKRPDVQPAPQSRPKTDNGLSPYTDLWVAHIYGTTEINKVFLNKPDAQKYADDQNENNKHLVFYNKKSKGYSVLSLDDAIWEVKQAIDDERMQDEDY